MALLVFAFILIIGGIICILMVPPITALAILSLSMLGAGFFALLTFGIITMFTASLGLNRPLVSAGTGIFELWEPDQQQEQQQQQPEPPETAPMPYTPTATHRWTRTKLWNRTKANR